MNSFGKAFVVTTFGESHGAGIGCVIDGVPAGLKIDLEFLQNELNRRKPGQNAYSTPRKEDDEFEILSGVFEGFSTGTPIALFIRNTNQKSKDYSNIKDLFRPSHADFTYFSKYGIRDYRGGGRSSARETAARVAAGAIAKMILNEFDIKVQSGISGIGKEKASTCDFDFAKKSEIYAICKEKEAIWQDLVLKAKKAHNSIGGEVFVKISSMKAGLGEPMYDKLDSSLASAMMGINGVKAVEIGDGVNMSKLTGSEANDQMDKDKFLSNHSGGIQGGISSGEDVDIKVHFKPTPSIFLPQQTRDIHGKSVECNLKGRHDPCIAIRGSVVAEAMASLVVVDMLLLNVKTTMKGLKEFYEKR